MSLIESTPFPASLILSNPLGSNGGHAGAWQPLHSHHHHHSFLIWTTDLFPSLSSEKQIYLLTFDMCPLIPSGSQIEPHTEMGPPITASLGMTRPPGRRASSALTDP